MAITKAKLAKFNDSQLQQELISAKYFIELYDKQLRDDGFAFLPTFEQKKILDGSTYHHEEYGKLLRELFIRKNTK